MEVVQNNSDEGTIEQLSENLQLLVSIQQILVKSGYSYIAVDEGRWPDTSVLMADVESPLLIDIWPIEPSAEALARWQKFTLWEKNAGLLLIGRVNIHDNAIEHFFQTTRGAIGYIDACTRQYRLSPLPVWLQHPPRILQELHLARALTAQRAASAAEVDCRASMRRDTQVAGRNRDYAMETEKLHSAKSAPFTHLLILACILVYLGTTLTAEHFNIEKAPFNHALRLWGALDGILICHGEWWRILTAGFLHGEGLHLLTNMLVLYWLAAPLECLQGAGRLAIYFFYSLITGFLLSLLCAPMMRAVGASGGIFGLVGVYAAMPVRFRAEMPPSWRTLILKCLLAIFCYSVLIALLVPGIDWIAHLGGLIGGFVIALILLRSPIRDSPRPRWSAVALAILLGATALLAVLTAMRISSL